VPGVFHFPAVHVVGNLVRTRRGEPADPVAIEGQHVPQGHGNWDRGWGYGDVERGWGVVPPPPLGGLLLLDQRGGGRRHIRWSVHRGRRVIRSRRGGSRLVWGLGVFIHRWMLAVRVRVRGLRVRRGHVWGGGLRVPLGFRGEAPHQERVRVAPKNSAWATSAGSSCQIDKIPAYLLTCAA
jgi:hypothetical protein